jgi:hypothetical protein
MNHELIATNTGTTFQIEEYEIKLYLLHIISMLNMCDTYNEYQSDLLLCDW